MAPRVLVLGLPRTGTQSIADALHTLGIEPVYHMRVVKERGDAERWVKLMKAKFESSSARGVDIEAELQEVLKDFDATIDFPTSLFAQELTTLYPHARIILTKRPEDAWMKSMQSTLVHAQNSTSHASTEMSRLYHKNCWRDDFEKYGRDYARAYREEVLGLVEERKLEYLEFDVREGWGPLCEVLGKDVPIGEHGEVLAFPRRDDWGEYKRVNGTA